MAHAEIMVVAVEITVAKDFKNRLNDMGYLVPATACSGQEAIAQAEMTHPDLTLMEIELQGEIDGIETARRLRKQFDIPVVFITANSDNNLLRHAMRTEPLGFVVKPVRNTELEATVEIALYNDRMAKKLSARVKHLNRLVESSREVFCFWESSPNRCQSCDSRNAIKIQLGGLERGLFTLLVCSKCFEVESYFEERTELAAHDLEAFSQIEGDLKAKMDLAEKYFLEQALALSKGEKPKAARLLEIALRTIYYKIERYGLDE